MVHIEFVLYIKLIKNKDKQFSIHPHRVRAAAACPIVLRCRVDELQFCSPCRNRCAKTWMLPVGTTSSGTRCVSNQRVHPLEVELPLSLMLIHIQVIISAVISYHPSSFCVLETLRVFLAGFFFWQESRSQMPGGGTILREQGKRNREHGEHVFALVFAEKLWGNPIAVNSSPIGTL